MSEYRPLFFVPGPGDLEPGAVLYERDDAGQLEEFGIVDRIDGGLLVVLRPGPARELPLDLAAVTSSGRFATRKALRRID